MQVHGCVFLGFHWIITEVIETPTLRNPFPFSLEITQYYTENPFTDYNVCSGSESATTAGLCSNNTIQSDHVVYESSGRCFNNLKPSARLLKTSDRPLQKNLVNYLFFSDDHRVISNLVHHTRASSFYIHFFFIYIYRSQFTSSNSSHISYLVDIDIYTHQCYRIEFFSPIHSSLTIRGIGFRHFNPQHLITGAKGLENTLEIRCFQKVWVDAITNPCLSGHG